MGSAPRAAGSPALTAPRGRQIRTRAMCQGRGWGLGQTVRSEPRKRGACFSGLSRTPRWEGGPHVPAAFTRAGPCLWGPPPAPPQGSSPPGHVCWMFRLIRAGLCHREPRPAAPPLPHPPSVCEKGLRKDVGADGTAGPPAAAGGALDSLRTSFPSRGGGLGCPTEGDTVFVHDPPHLGLIRTARGKSDTLSPGTASSTTGR